MMLIDFDITYIEIESKCNICNRHSKSCQLCGKLLLQMIHFICNRCVTLSVTVRIKMIFFP